MIKLKINIRILSILLLYCKILMKELQINMKIHRIDLRCIKTIMLKIETKLTIPST